jgi:hypothetical protein
LDVAIILREFVDCSGSRSGQKRAGIRRGHPLPEKHKPIDGRLAAAATGTAPVANHVRNIRERLAETAHVGVGKIPAKIWPPIGFSGSSGLVSKIWRRRSCGVAGGPGLGIRGLRAGSGSFSITPDRWLLGWCAGRGALRSWRGGCWLLVASGSRGAEQRQRRQHDYYHEKVCRLAKMAHGRVAWHAKRNFVPSCH